jgi:pimeloyl-ACP methyl ester carboxylesterase
MTALKKFIVAAITLLLLVLLFSLYWRMHAYRNSFDRRDMLIAGSIPAHIYLPDAQKPPIVIVAHGFTANKEMMQSLNYSLVRDGFAVVSFDFRGHGQNTTAFDGLRLQEDMDQVIAFAKNMNEKMPFYYDREQIEVDTDRIAIMGHSMGGGSVARYGIRDLDIDATVPISGVHARVSVESPRNMFIIYAENDPEELHHAARWMLEQGTKGEKDLRADTTYGSFESGTARRMNMVKNTDHITILFSSEAHEQILDWLHQVWELPPRTVKASDPRLAWMGLMYLFSSLLFLCCCYGLSWYIPSIKQRTGRESLMNLVLFAAACLLALFVIMPAPPLSFIPMPIGSYLISYFFVVGIIYLVIALRTGNIVFDECTSGFAKTVLAAFVLFLFVYVTSASITTEIWFRQFFTGQRLLWALVMVPLLLPFFVAFEASFKRGNTLTAAIISLVGIVIALGMLVLGMGLGLTPGFIMLIVIPMAIYNIIYQLFSIYIYHLSRNYLVTALFHTLVMSWQFAVLFPIS